jgi:hypothetical protein
METNYDRPSTLYHYTARQALAPLPRTRYAPAAEQLRINFAGADPSATLAGQDLQGRKRVQDNRPRPRTAAS